MTSHKLTDVRDSDIADIWAVRDVLCNIFNKNALLFN